MCDHADLDERCWFLGVLGVLILQGLELGSWGPARGVQRADFDAPAACHHCRFGQFRHSLLILCKSLGFPSQKVHKKLAVA